MIFRSRCSRDVNDNTARIDEQVIIHTIDNLEQDYKSYEQIENNEKIKTLSMRDEGN